MHSAAIGDWQAHSCLSSMATLHITYSQGCFKGGVPASQLRLARHSLPRWCPHGHAWRTAAKLHQWMPLNMRCGNSRDPWPQCALVQQDQVNKESADTDLLFQSCRHGQLQATGKQLCCWPHSQCTCSHCAQMLSVFRNRSLQAPHWLLQGALQRNTLHHSAAAAVCCQGDALPHPLPQPPCLTWSSQFEGSLAAFKLLQVTLLPAYCPLVHVRVLLRLTFHPHPLPCPKGQSVLKHIS